MSIRDELAAARDLAGRTVKGVVAGCIAGAVASWAMNKFQEVSSQPLNDRESRGQNRADEVLAGERSSDSAESSQSAEASGGSGDDANVKTAQAVSRKLFEHELSADEKKIAGPAVHYAYGTVVGGVYGGLAELIPAVSMGLGVPYAALLFALGDEVAVTALGLSGSPTESPLDAHASALAAHFAFGITLDITRRVVRRII